MLCDLQDAFGSAQNKAGHHAESAKDQGKGLFETAQDKTSSFLDTAGDKAQGAKHDAKVLLHAACTMRVGQQGRSVYHFASQRASHFASCMLVTW